MVLESIRSQWLEHHPLLSFGIGLLYTFLGALIAQLFFRTDPSIPVLFLTTLLIVPSLITVLNREERVERKVGLRHFFRNHRAIMEIYLFLFLGIFAGYLLLGWWAGTDSPLFTHQLTVLQDEQGLSSEHITNFLEENFQPSMAHFLGVLQSNVLVLLALFALSFFYGAGAIFLIVLNASVFAAFVLYVLDALATHAVSFWTVLGIFAIHLLPEVSGFLLAAIAGGVVSKAVLHEKFGSDRFRNVVRDALALLCLAVALLILGAALEVFVTTRVFAGVF